jgi:hypothetical protein
MLKVALLAALAFGVVLPLGAVLVRRTPADRERTAALRRAGRRR